MSKTITFIGSPSSGKSTLATDIHTELKKLGHNSIYIQEAATDYIAENGVPNTPIDQMVIFYSQLNREKMFIGSKEFVVCDSSTILNYFYFRTLFRSPLSNQDIAAINHIQREILKTISSWSYIFYLPPILESDSADNIRFHDKDQISKIDIWIKSYLELEMIPYIDLSDISIKNRPRYILDIITK